MVELLVVIVIIGVMAALIGPTFIAGSDTARVKTASRGVMQMSRYARTMAILHQTPVDLVFTADGALSVEQVALAGEGVVSDKSFASTNAAATEAEAAAEALSDATEAAEFVTAGGSVGGGSSYVMADLNITQKYEQTVFLFEGYSDSMDEGRSAGDRRKSWGSDAAEEEAGEGGEEAVKAFRVRYKSNGTCRPFAVRVAADAEGTYSVKVIVDVLGSAKIEAEDER